MEQCPSWEVNMYSADHKFPAFHGTQRIITELTSARHLPQALNLISSVHPPFQFLKIHFNIMLPSTSRSYKWFFSSDIPTKTIHTPLVAPIRATCTFHVIPLHFIAWIMLWELQVEISCWLIFSTPCYHVPLRPECLPWRYNLDYHEPALLHNVTDEVSHTYKIT
jgi:hypothetical protein